MTSSIRGSIVRRSSVVDTLWLRSVKSYMGHSSLPTLQYQQTVAQNHYLEVPVTVATMTFRVYEPRQMPAQK